MRERGAVTGSPGREYGLGRVMIVDGHADWTPSVQAWLSSAGFEALACGPGDHARATFDERRPDLVVLSASLDDGSSPIALCAWVRSRSDVPIVVATSSRPLVLDRAHVLDSGADMVVDLPVGQHELVARLRALLRRTPPRLEDKAAVLRYGSLELDRERRVLLAGCVDEQVELRLDGREYEVMEALTLGGSKVTNRRVLRVALGVSDSELDGTVRRLRERLEAVEGWRRVVTQRGVGFRLLDAKPAATEATQSSAG